MRFFKSYAGQFGILKQGFLARIELVVTSFSPWKIPKCLENGQFRDPRWVKNGSKMHFYKGDPTPFGRLKKLILARFHPVVTHYGPWKMPKCLENGPFWAQTWFKKGSKMRFSKSYDGPFGILKQGFLARFEPVVTSFGPWKIPKCLQNGLFGDPRWVKKWVKNAFSRRCSHTIWEVDRTAFSPFSPCGDALWSMENPKLP